MSLAALLNNQITSVRDSSDEDPGYVDIIKFIESSWGLNQRLYPSQKFLLKLYYGLELSDDLPESTWNRKTYRGIPVHDMFMKNVLYQFSEIDFLKYLYEEGCCNVKEPSSTLRDLVLCIGRRGSKSYMTSYIIAYEIYKLLSMYSPHAYYGISESQTISLTTVATVGPQAKALFDLITNHISGSKFFSQFIQIDTQEHMSFYTRRTLEEVKDKPFTSIDLLFRPTVAAAMRGPTNKCLVFDEFAHVPDSGGNSAEELYVAATPSLATFKNPVTGNTEGRVIAISSPLNRSGKFFELFTRAMETGGSEGTLAIRAPTWVINPTVDGNFLQKQHRSNPNRFDCEYGAIFSDRLVGWISREEDLLQNIRTNLRPKKMSYSKSPHFMGIDLGLSQDGTAIAVTHLDGDLVELDYIDVRYPGVDEWSNRIKIDFDEVADWIVEVTRKFNIQSGIFDKYSGVVLEQALKKRGIKYLQSDEMSPAKISEMWMTAKILMMDNKLKLFDYPILEGETHCEYIKELLQLQETRKSKHISSVAAPKLKNKHDDLSDALVRSIWMAHQYNLEGSNTDLTDRFSKKTSSVQILKDRIFRAKVEQAKKRRNSILARNSGFRR